MDEIYELDLNLQTENLINPLHRTDVNLDFIGSIAANLQQLRDDLFDNFKKGTAYPDYNALSTYTLRDRVRWTDLAVYELQSITSTGVDPTGNVLSYTNWRKIQQSYIGTNENIRYTSQRIVIEYALNKRFGLLSPNLIYTYTNPTSGSASFQVYIKTSVYNSLASTNPDRVAIIVDALSRFNIAGVYAGISTY